MNTEQEIKKLKEAIDCLRVQIAVLYAKEKALGNILLGILPYLSTKDFHASAYTHYVNTLGDRLRSELSDVTQFLFENPNSFLEAQKDAIRKQIQDMKTDEAYRQSKG
ncbi:MAG: hypothetical protein LBS05_09500 [Tannerellaceae bacterium]|jgi:hypothetical protein|nr:hypothetical protein [Tannerellaceae bacterium]